MNLPAFGLPGLEKTQGLGNRDLINQDLIGAQFLLRNPVARLDDARLCGFRCCGNPGCAREEGANAHGIGCIVRTLIDHLQDIITANDTGRHLNAAGAPAIGQGHLPAAKGYLIARDGDRLQNAAADHPLRLFVQIGEIVAGFALGPAGLAFARAHSAASC